MRITRTPIVAVVALAVAGTSCGVGSTQDVLVERRTVSPGATTLIDPTTVPATSLPATTVPAVPERLSIDDALLGESDVEPPWDFQYSNAEQPGYGAGPNQTDCPPYWEYERLHDLPSGSAFWWRDGGNLTHEVFRADSPDAAAAFVATMRSLPEQCAVTSWSEGDWFEILPVDLGEDVVGLEFLQPNGSDLQHVAIMSRGDLVSVIWVVQWPPFDDDGEFPHTPPADLAALAARARTLLDTATVLPTKTVPSSTTTTTTVPTASTVPAPTLPSPTLPGPTLPPGTPPPITLPPIPAPSTTMPGTEPPIESLLLIGFMLTSEDLAELPGWEAGTPRSYDVPVGDTSLGDGCESEEIVEEIDKFFLYENDLFLEFRSVAEQFIGDAEDADHAISLVEGFVELAECDLSDLFPGGTVTGGFLDIEGTSAAGYVEFVIEHPAAPGELTARIVLLASETRLSGLTISWGSDAPIDAATVTRLIEIAGAKLAG